MAVFVVLAVVAGVLAYVFQDKLKAWFQSKV